MKALAWAVVMLSGAVLVAAASIATAIIEHDMGAAYPLFSVGGLLIVSGLTGLLLSKAGGRE